MKEYIGVQFKIVFFEMEDIITESGDVYFDNELPMVPIGG